MNTYSNELTCIGAQVRIYVCVSVIYASVIDACDEKQQRQRSAVRISIQLLQVCVCSVYSICVYTTTTDESNSLQIDRKYVAVKLEVCTCCGIFLFVHACSHALRISRFDVIVIIRRSLFVFRWYLNVVVAAFFCISHHTLECGMDSSFIIKNKMNNI